MFINLSTRFVQNCAKQTLGNFVRTLSNVQSKPLPSEELADNKKDYRDKNIKVQLLKEMLNLRLIEAASIVSKPKFSKITSNSINKNYNLCLSHKITQARLKQFPEILAEEKLADKIELVKQLPFTLDHTAALLNIPTARLEKLMHEEELSQRIRFLSTFFNVTEKQACAWMATRRFLISLKEEQIKEITELLLRFGLDKNDISKDFWVLKYSKATVENRLKQVQESNAGKVKTWMVRAKPELFENYVKRQSERKSVLGDNSFAEYLCNKLGCTRETAEYIILKLPVLQHKCLIKLNSIIEYLVENGFSTSQICSNPRILLHSLETIKKRMERLKALGTQPDFLSVLTRSQKNFEDKPPCRFKDKLASS
ncbi:unnamed protein product [Callosobruchus maculatus]|uniref:Transcription termination factor, mitochondrial n=1 Tax=Callosobruchus maculatus TaxID=64391 RepID=A0A653C6K4_CALMS|nr:unnamed protein product [Callosobruchus maculatus]